MLSSAPSNVILTVKVLLGALSSALKVLNDALRHTQISCLLEMSNISKKILDMKHQYQKQNTMNRKYLYL